MGQYEKALKLWNIVFWISIMGLVGTVIVVAFFIQAGVQINWILWGAIGFYLLGAINAEIWMRAIEKEKNEHE